MPNKVRKIRCNYDKLKRFVTLFPINMIEFKVLENLLKLSRQLEDEFRAKGCFKEAICTV